jgi:hypothetical protein
LLPVAPYILYRPVILSLERYKVLEEQLSNTVRLVITGKKNVISHKNVGPHKFKTLPDALRYLKHYNGRYFVISDSVLEKQVFHHKAVSKLVVEAEDYVDVKDKRYSFVCNIPTDYWELLFYEIRH